MQRREFLMHSGIMLAVALVGVPTFGFDSQPEPTANEGCSSHFRLYGSKRDGCAHLPTDINALHFAHSAS